MHLTARALYTCPSREEGVVMHQQFYAELVTEVMLMITPPVALG